jgi:regulator of replication initiation timing
LTDKIDALEQQKSVFQQSVAHTQGELDVLHQQLSDFKSQNQILTKEQGELKQRLDMTVLGFFFIVHHINNISNTDFCCSKASILSVKSDRRLSDTDNSWFR